MVWKKKSESNATAFQVGLLQWRQHHVFTYFSFPTCSFNMQALDFSLAHMPDIRKESRIVVLCRLRRRLKDLSRQELLFTVGAQEDREAAHDVLQGVTLENVLIGSDRTLSRYLRNRGSCSVLTQNLVRMLFPGSSHREISILDKRRRHNILYI